MVDDNMRLFRRDISLYRSIIARGAQPSDGLLDDIMLGSETLRAQVNNLRRLSHSTGLDRSYPRRADRRLIRRNGIIHSMFQVYHGNERAQQ